MQTTAMSDPRGYPSDEQVNKALEGCENARDYLITRILSRTGLRISECLAIKKSDVLFRENQIIVRQLKKGNEAYRNAYIDPETCEMIKQYVSKYSIKEDELLFNITAHSYNRILKEISIGNKIGDIGKKKWLHPHHFRHYFVMKAIKKGVDIRKIQMLVGHSNYATTASYMQYGGKELRDSYEELWKDDDTDA